VKSGVTLITLYHFNKLKKKEKKKKREMKIPYEQLLFSISRHIIFFFKKKLKKKNNQ